MNARGPIRILLCAIVTLAKAAPAAAGETYTRLDLTDTSIGFTSPGNASVLEIEDLRAVLLKWAAAGVARFAHQNDGDVNYPIHGNYIGAGIIGNLSSRFYAYLNFGYGTASPYARTDFHVEAD